MHFLFGLRGRIARASFCLFLAVGFVLLLALLSALYMYDLLAGNYENGGPTPWPTSPLAIAGAVAWFLVLVLLFVSGVAVTLKRLHDRDKSWWWLLIFVLAPNALSSLAAFWRDQYPSFGEIGFVLDFSALVILIWAFVELACLKGTTGDNRFGADPLQRMS